MILEFKSAVDWLKSTLSDEADDRDGDSSDVEEGVAILPLQEDCIAAMEKEQFLKLMKILEISPPGEVYWNLTITRSFTGFKKLFILKPIRFPIRVCFLRSICAIRDKLHLDIFVNSSW